MYGKTSREFTVTRGICQGCVLAPTLFNLNLDAVISLPLGDQQEKGMRNAYLHGARLVGDRRKLEQEMTLGDLEPQIKWP